MRVIEFDEHLLPTAKRRLHHMKIYRDYIEERRRLGEMAVQHYQETGTLSGETVMEAMRQLEAHGQELFVVMQRLQSEVANSDSDRA